MNLSLNTDCSLNDQGFPLLNPVSEARRENDDLCAASDKVKGLATKKKIDLQQENACLFPSAKPAMSMSSSDGELNEVGRGRVNATTRRESAASQIIERLNVNNSLGVYSLSPNEDQDSTTSFDSSIESVGKPRTSGSDPVLGNSRTVKQRQPNASRGKSSRRRQIKDCRHSETIQKVPSLIICKTSSNKSIPDEEKNEWCTSRCEPALSRAAVGLERVSFDSSPRKPTRKESWNDRPCVNKSKSHVSVDSSPVKPTRQRSVRSKDVDSMVKSLSCELLCTTAHSKSCNDLPSVDIK